MNANSMEYILTSALCSAIPVLVEVATSQGIKAESPVQQYDVIWFKQDDGKGIMQRETHTEFSRLDTLLLLRKLAFSADLSSSMRALGDLALSIVQRGSWPMGVRSPSESDALGELLLGVYLARVNALVLDETIAARVISEFIADVLADSFEVRSVYLVTDLAAPRAFPLAKDVELRPISGEEFDKFGRVPPGGWLDADQPWLNSSDWICEISTVGPKSSFQAFNVRRDAIDEIMVALNLTSLGRSGFRLLENRCASPYFSSGTVRSRTVDYSGGSGNKVVLSDRGLEEFIENYALVKRVMTDSRFERMRLPFRRLRFAASRSQNEDKIVDYVVGLERLLAPDTQTLEITYRFRLRGAAILTESFGSIEERRRFMGKVYDLRSSIVHGNATSSDVDVMLPKVENAFTVTLRWFAKAVELLGQQNVVPSLDDALVTGGSQWAVGFWPKGPET